MGEPVKQGAQQPFIGEYLGPLAEGQVGGNQERTLLVALADEREEQVRTLLRKGQEAQFVDENELLFHK